MPKFEPMGLNAFVFCFRFDYLGDSARNVMLFDKLPIVCPSLGHYPVRRDDVYSKDSLYENLFLVDKAGYDTCNATTGYQILYCDKPLENKHTTVVFQSRSADPSVPLFLQGKEYYFISKCWLPFNKSTTVFYG